MPPDNCPGRLTPRVAWRKIDRNMHRVGVLEKTIRLARSRPDRSVGVFAAAALAVGDASGAPSSASISSSM